MTEFHPLADMFPMLGDAELSELAEDIRANGQHEPIWLYEGKILDGRNRYCACAAAGVAPTFRTYEGDQPVAFVISLNLHRRHLTYDQRVGLALKVKPMLEEEARERQRGGQGGVLLSANSQQAKGRAAEHAAKTTGVGSRVVYEMAAAAERNPTIVDDLLAGKTTVRDERKKQQRIERIEKIVNIAKGELPLSATGQQFPVLYVDPPWQYEHSETDSRMIENHYPTMTLDAICAMPIHEVATPDCVLFMWATSPKLGEAFQVLRSWGFTYRTCAVWVKDKIGMGYYFRQQHELLLVAAKGSIPVPEPSSRVSSIISAPRTEHSAKPHEVYEVIERMYPELPKVELFSRSPRDGWHAWGNQI